MGAINILERLRCRFFWGLKENEKCIVWIKWKNTLPRREKGGLLIGSIKAKNLSLLGKWRWRFKCDRDSLWCKVIEYLHGNDGGFLSSSGSGLKEGVWDGIRSNLVAIENIGVSWVSSFRRKMGSGYIIKFWMDSCWDSRICQSTRLDALETNKGSMICDR